MAMGGVFSFSGSRPGAIVSVVALGVLLSLLAADVARSFVPVVAGSARVLAPGLLRTLANGTEAAAVLTGGGVRVAVSQGVNVGGMGVSAQLARTASRDSLAKALAGLAAGAGIAAVLDEALDKVDCDLGVGGFKCASVSPPSPTTLHCFNLTAWNKGSCAESSAVPAAGVTCFRSVTEFADAVKARAAQAGGYAISHTVTQSAGPFGFVLQYSRCGQNLGGGQYVTNSTQQSFACPSGFVASQLTAGQCRPESVQSWPSASVETVRSRLASKDGWVSVPVARELGKAGAEIPETEAPTVVEQVSPSPVPLPYTRRTWVLPGGDQVIEEVRPEYELTPSGDVINWRLIERRTVTPPGATVPGTPPTTSETIVPGGGATLPQPPVQSPPGAEPTPQPQEDLECGLPGKPPCKIDETGTPDGQGLVVPDLQPVTAPFLACVANPAGCLPSLPALNWSFAMPTACGPIPLPAFASWGLEAVDICAFQATFHDLMSMVWVIGGLFGAIGLFWRKTLAVA